MAFRCSPRRSLASYCRVDNSPELPIATRPSGCPTARAPAGCSCTCYVIPHLTKTPPERKKMPTITSTRGLHLDAFCCSSHPHISSVPAI
jgi:hypothetical protein